MMNALKYGAVIVPGATVIGASLGGIASMETKRGIEPSHVPGTVGAIGAATLLGASAGPFIADSPTNPGHMRPGTRAAAAVIGGLAALGAAASFMGVANAFGSSESGFRMPGSY